VLGDSNPVYYKTETIMLFSNYLSSKVGEKKTGEQFAFRGQTVPLTRGGLERKNGINHIFPR
jgi:hypothetical protein